MSSKVIERWLNAQYAEKKFHKNDPTLVAKQGSKHVEFLRSWFGINYDSLKDKNILEIGSGTRGIIYYIEEVNFRIGVEPMNISNILEAWKKPYALVGIGENLPFKDKSFDIVICVNVLDHVIEPMQLFKNVEEF